MKKVKNANTHRPWNINLNSVSRFSSGRNKRTKGTDETKKRNNDKHRPRNNSRPGKAGLRPKQLRWTFETSVAPQENDRYEHWMTISKAVSPEQRMWWSVLAQALHEYLGTKSENTRVKTWIISNSTEVGSYLWICELLSICPTTLKKKVLMCERPIKLSQGVARTWGCYVKNM